MFKTKSKKKTFLLCANDIICTRRYIPIYIKYIVKLIFCFNYEIIIVMLFYEINLLILAFRYIYTHTLYKKKLKMKEKSLFLFVWALPVPVRALLTPPKLFDIYIRKNDNENELKEPIISLNI